MTSEPETRSPAPRRRSARLDVACAAAVDVARAALTETDLDDGANVGEHLGAVAEGERLVTHLFECLLVGYRGWRYAATVTRIARSKQVTVCETALLPGPDSIIAPTWLPWNERLQPGDLGVGDLMPTVADDDRLSPAYLESDDPAVEAGEFELGVGRQRVMSRLGRLDTAERWHEGDHGPHAAIAKAAPTDARCGTCGFYLPVAGSLRALFGVCGNLYAPDDGRVVSADHGCGAHSEVVAEAGPVVDALTTVYDDASVERVST
ncbi:MAG: DUF3027 domain-containing protein [Actinocatenispora sp.]